MANGIRTGDLRGFNKGRCSKFRGDANKDEYISPKTLNDKNQASSQKFRQLLLIYPIVSY